jgi:hypothetical protein
MAHVSNASLKRPTRPGQSSISNNRVSRRRRRHRRRRITLNNVSFLFLIQYE